MVLVSPQDELNAATTSIVEATVPVASTSEEIGDAAIVVGSGVSSLAAATTASATSSSASTSFSTTPTPGVKTVQTVTLSKALLQKNAVQTVGGQQIVFIALPAGTKVAASS